MKNRNLILLIAIIINMSLFAQNKNDSVRTFKNEIGINLLPFVNKCNLRNSDRAIINIFYKRQLNKNWFGRVSFVVFNNNNNNLNNNLVEIKGLPNSKLSFQYTQNEPKQYLQYNLGIERRFGKGLVKQFAGLDLGFAHYQTKHTEMYGIRDSINNNQTSLIFQKDSTIFREQTTANSIIFTPFYGLQFNINKHFLFSTQAGVALSFTQVNNKTLIDNRIIKTQSNSISNFDLNITNVSCNFSLCYRF